MGQRDLFGKAINPPPLSPILEHLIPLGIEKWRQEGLFKRSRFLNSQRTVQEIPAGAKIKFVQDLYARWISWAPREYCESQGSSGMPRNLIMVERRIQVKKKFDKVSDANMREIMKRMICTEKTIGAHYIAKQLGIRWPQFVEDFNTGLNEMMEEQYETERTSTQ